MIDYVIPLLRVLNPLTTSGYIVVPFAFMAVDLSITALLSVVRYKKCMK